MVLPQHGLPYFGMELINLSGLQVFSLLLFLSGSNKICFLKDGYSAIFSESSTNHPTIIFFQSTSSLSPPKLFAIRLPFVLLRYD